MEFYLHPSCLSYGGFGDERIQIIVIYVVKTGSSST